MTLATKITCLRLALVPVGVGFLFLEQLPGNYVWAMLVFVVGFLTDVVDGNIARRTGTTTAIGACLDSMADKMLMLLYFVYLQDKDLFPLWLLMLVLARSIVINSIRSYMLQSDPLAGSSFFGKVHWLLIAVAITIGIAALAAENGQLAILADYGPQLRQSAYVMMLAGFVMSIAISPRALLRQARMLTGTETRPSLS